MTDSPPLPRLRSYLVSAWCPTLQRFLAATTTDTAALPVLAEGFALQHDVAFAFSFDGERIAHLGEWYAADRKPGTRAEDRRDLRIRRAHAAWSAAVYLAPLDEVGRLADEHKRIVGECSTEMEVAA